MEGKRFGLSERIFNKKRKFGFGFQVNILNYNKALYTNIDLGIPWLDY